MVAIFIGKGEVSQRNAGRVFELAQAAQKVC